MSEILPDGESRNLQLIAERMRGRRTTKLFLRQRVSKKLVHDAIEVARWAPNHHLTEPWHFYSFGDETIVQTVELIRTIAAETKDEDVAEFKAKSAAAIPGWLLVTCKKSDDELLQRENYASCCCAIQNLTLYLSEAGVASKWTTGLITRDERFFDLLKIDSSDEFVVGLIWYGYPKILPTQSRKGVDEILTEMI
ncbi:MAG: nitroreductase [Proteobacteria bacterium]|nr:nitroreductase [Pseudomonadota bacterium]MDA0994279.1 nitroreductase [Pseudomonadota bacterium]